MTRAPADQSVRDRVVRDFDTTLLLEAGAGTGKTTVLVSRILALVRSGRATLDRIVAITFTEKAAGELKLRLREEIERALETTADETDRERLAAATSDIERAPVSTIHSFAANLLRERPFEAGLDPGFAVAAEIAGERVLEDTWDAWFDRRMSEADPALVRALALGLKIADLRTAARRMASDRDILGRPEPRAAFDVASLRGQLRETVAALQPLKARCADPEDEAYQQILALDVVLPRAGHAEGLALERLLRELYVVAHKGQQANWNPKEACKEAKAALKSLKDAQAAYVAASDADLAWSLRDKLRGFLEAYALAKRERAVVDFADLLLQTRDVLARSLAVRRYFQKRFDFILVDEFQDTDPLQAQIAFFLAEDPAAPPATEWTGVHLAPGKLFVVGDPKQSIYRFRRADIAIYQEVKRLIEASGGEVLPLTANFRTVPSVLAFVNERFKVLFTLPEDPSPRPLDAYRPEVASKGARMIALPLPPDRLTDDRKVETIRPLVAETIAAFVDEITRERPWSIRDRGGDAVRPARPGDVGLLVRKMTPEFIGPFEDEFAKRDIPYRLVGGKEYYAREEVQALTAVLRAIDNPADRLAVFAALRSPFFGLSDDDVFRFVSGGGTLNPLAPLKDGVHAGDLVGRAFGLLQALHRRRRMQPPSDVIASLFERTRSLPAFRVRANGDQSVANLWKVLDVARAYESAGPATLREVVRFLQTEARSGREEGDSPVGEQAGAQLEVLTVHKAKGLEYPIVIVADLLSNRPPASDVIVRHATGEGWIRIGGFEPAGWEAAKADEARQQEAEERRLLYVALTRARDHLVIPCFPDKRRAAWLDDAIAGFALDGREPAYGKRSFTIAKDGTRGEAEVTWHDSRGLQPVEEPGRRVSATVAISGTDADARRALVAEEAWEAERKERRAAARKVAPPVFSAAGAPPEPPADAEPEKQAPDEVAAELSATDPGVEPAAGEDRPEAFGRLVHALLGMPDGKGRDLAAAARALATSFGLTEADGAAALDLARRAVALPEIAAAGKADLVFRDLPFAVPLRGELTSGRIDMAYRKGGAWTVVDFKTAGFRDPAEALAAHGPQLAASAEALAAVTGAPAARALCLLADGRLVAL